MPTTSYPVSPLAALADALLQGYQAYDYSKQRYDAQKLQEEERQRLLELQKQQDAMNRYNAQMQLMSMYSPQQQIDYMRTPDYLSLATRAGLAPPTRQVEKTLPAPQKLQRPGEVIEEGQPRKVMGTEVIPPDYQKPFGDQTVGEFYQARGEQVPPQYAKVANMKISDAVQLGWKYNLQDPEVESLKARQDARDRLNLILKNQPLEKIANTPGFQNLLDQAGMTLIRDENGKVILQDTTQQVIYRPLGELYEGIDPRFMNQPVAVNPATGFPDDPTKLLAFFTKPQQTEPLSPEEQAVQDYLLGKPLTPQQQEYVNLWRAKLKKEGYIAPTSTSSAGKNIVIDGVGFTDNDLRSIIDQNNAARGIVSLANSPQGRAMVTNPYSDFPSKLASAQERLLTYSPEWENKARKALGLPLLPVASTAPSTPASGGKVTPGKWVIKGTNPETAEFLAQIEKQVNGDPIQALDFFNSFKPESLQAKKINTTAVKNYLTAMVNKKPAVKAPVNQDLSFNSPFGPMFSGY